MFGRTDGSGAVVVFPPLLSVELANARNRAPTKTMTNRISNLQTSTHRMCVCVCSFVNTIACIDRFRHIFFYGLVTASCHVSSRIKPFNYLQQLRHYYATLSNQPNIFNQQSVVCITNDLIVLCFSLLLRLLLLVHTTSGSHLSKSVA